MKRIAVLVFAMLVLLTGSALAKNVTVTGVGITPSDAENDALRLAVENTLGVLVDSNTLVEKGAVIHDQIYTQSRGFVTDYRVVGKTQENGVWSVTIEATVDDTPNSRLMNELTRLGIINTQLRNPKIAVYVPEQHLQYNISNSAGETAIVKTLIESGFSQVTEVGSRLNISNPLAMTAAEMTRAANMFGVDIMIVGESFSEGVGEAAQWLPGTQRSNMQSCRARVEAKMFIVKTGQIIATDGKYGSGLDNSESIAAKKALSAAGKQMGEYLVQQITGLYTSQQNIEVIVYGAAFQKITEVQTALGAVRGVKNCNLSSYEGGRAVFSVAYSGSPQTLFNEMQRATDANLILQSLAYNTLTIQVR